IRVQGPIGCRTTRERNVMDRDASVCARCCFAVTRATRGPVRERGRSPERNDEKTRRHGDALLGAELLLHFLFPFSSTPSARAIPERLRHPMQRARRNKHTSNPLDSRALIWSRPRDSPYSPITPCRFCCFHSAIDAECETPRRITSTK